jgi:ABC-type phosphate transport system auxiliary subunit
LTPETGGSEGTEEENTEAMLPMQTGEAAAWTPEAEVATQVGPRVEGRRTQLRILRENIQSLSKDVGNFRKSHEGSTRRLEKQVATLRNELAVHTRSKVVGNLSKNHEASTKRLEKEVATLRNELAALKSDIAKDAARSKAKQEAILSKILAKVSTKASKRARGTKKR